MSTKRNKKSQANDDSYEVGYGKPPKQTQFKPEQSGNPKGRPKGSRNISTDVKATLKEPVRVTKNGKSRKVSTQMAVLLRLREKALGGDIRSLDRLINLAQTYNNEELAAAAGLSKDDNEILEMFKQRVLRGAAVRDAEPREDSAGGESENPSSADAESDEPAEGGHNTAPEKASGAADSTPSDTEREDEWRRSGIGDEEPCTRAASNDEKNDSWMN